MWDVGAEKIFSSELLGGHGGCVRRDEMDGIDNLQWLEFNPWLAEFCLWLLFELHDHELRNMRLRSDRAGML
jgi:hypothetical protein